ncbi:MAG: thioredoxin family protein [Bacteroidota bacterium]
MKKIFFFVSLLMLASGIVFAQQKTEKSSAPKFDPSRDPFADVKTAVVEAEKTNKRILLDVGGEWCIWCHRIDSFIEQNDEINKFLHENFVVVKVNWSPENKNEKFLTEYPKVAGFPHFFILEKDGKFLHSQNTGLLEKEKSYDSEKMLNFFKEWASKKSGS